MNTPAEPTRLSESRLFELQEAFYHREGMSAWNETPLHATSSSFVSEAYAEVALAFLLDSRIDLREPVWFLELGAGPACFTHRFLTELTRKMSAFSALRDLKIQYMMSDFSPTMREAWTTNAFLRPWVDRGILQFEIFRPDSTPPPDRQLVNPVFVIANYVFDTLRQDAFRAEAGELFEVRVHVTNKVGTTSDQFSDLEVHEVIRPIQARGYYDEPAWNEILEHYQKVYSSAVFLIPIGALEVTRRLRSWAKGGMALMILDKGHFDLAANEGVNLIEHSIHGSISFGVNFDAVHRYLATCGGQTFCGDPSAKDLFASLSVMVPGSPPLERTGYVFAESLRRKDPFDALLSLERMLPPWLDPKDPDWIPVCLAGLRTLSYDPYAFERCAEGLERLTMERLTVEPFLWPALAVTLERVARNLDRTNTVAPAFLLRISFAIGAFDLCVAIADQCFAKREDTPWVLGLVARSHLALGQRDRALAALKKYRELEPQNEWAVAELNRVRLEVLLRKKG
ncbi:MAG: hypothetical protein HY791_23155 [Deltaproteobacteria bacterium]|nr:hypothetical protein [Deltaproteobacteria bacterium]